MTTRTRLHCLVVAALGIGLPVMHVLAQGQVDSGLTRNGTGPAAVRIAVNELHFVQNAVDSTGKLEKAFNDTLKNDLDFTGNIELVSSSFFPLGNFAAPRDIKAEDWTKPPVSAQYVVYGTLGLPTNRFSVAGYLRDLATGQDPVANAFQDSRDEQGAQRAAHLFADRILETLGFGKGIARTQITFASDRTGNKEIYVMDYDGNNQRRLTAIGNIAITPKWSPVDDRIAFTAWRGGDPRIEILSASGQKHSFDQPGGVTNSVPAWSADGKSIIYSSRRDGNTEIYRANADGKNVQQLTHSPQSDTSPSVNPKNGEIAFISGRSGTPELYIMDSDGTNVRRITNEGGEVANPEYSPDGSMIAFAWQKPRSGGFDLYLYDVGMRKFSQLTSDTRSNERPTWAPDGKHIAFQSKRNGSTQIYSMTLDGRKVQTLTKGPGISEGPSWSGFAAR